jgi:hypothetical protein
VKYSLDLKIHVIDFVRMDDSAVDDDGERVTRQNKKNFVYSKIVPFCCCVY